MHNPPYTSAKSIIRIAAPISLSMLIPQVNFFTNTMFLGRLGLRELGVNGITTVFYLILIMIGQGLSIGMQVQMSRRSGEGNRRELAHIFTNGTLLALLLSFILMLITLWTVPILFSLTLSDISNLSMSTDFVYIRVWGLPFLMLTQLFSAFFISTGNSRLLIFGSLTATITNIVLDYLLIFGKFGFPAMGYNGAALASVIAELLYFMAMLILFLKHRMHLIYPVLDYLKFDPDLAYKTLKVSAPLIVQFIFSIGGWLIFFIYVEHLGKMSLAASQLLRNVFGIVGVGTWAMASTCNTMVSKIIGQGRQTEVMKLILRICKISLLYALVVGGLLVLFSNQFLSIYTGDKELIQFAIPSLRIIALATLVMAISTVVFNGVVGTGNTLFNLALEITCVGIYLFYCYYFINLKRSPLIVCWGSEFVYWITLLIGSSLYLRSGRWKGKKV